MADYTNYVRDALFSVEETVRTSFKSIWTSAHPMWVILSYKGNHFNKGFNLSGSKLLLPICTADQANAADGVQVANELTPMTANTYAGVFQLEYQYAHYQSNIAIRSSDKNIVASNNSRGNFLEFLRKQCVDSFKNVLSYDSIVPTAAPTGLNTASVMDAVLSLRYMLSNANVVGGKDQALDTNWQAVYNTASGPFDLADVDRDLNTIKGKGRSSPDFFLAADVSGGYVYTAFMDSLRPGERYVPDAAFTRYSGFENFVYRGKTVILDNRNTAAELIGIASDTWYARLPEEPTALEMQRIGLTTGYEQTYELYAAYGCDDIGCNSRRTGITT